MVPPLAARCCADFLTYWTLLYQTFYLLLSAILTTIAVSRLSEVEKRSKGGNGEVEMNPDPDDIY